MIYPEAKLEEWLRKTGLSVEVYRCPKCGQDFPTCIPIVTKNYAGLESPIHGCGPGFTKLVMGPRSEKKRNLWNDIFENL